MSILRTLALTALALLAPLSARADTPEPAPAPAVTPKFVSKAETEKVIAFFNKFIDIIVANQDDCPKMASAISALADANKQLIADGKKAKAAGLQLPPEYKARMEARVKNDMLPALKKKCGNDKAVGEAIGKMGN